MSIITCPRCGEEINADDNAQSVQCQCGAIIVNYAKAQGGGSFNTQPDLELIKENHRKSSKKNLVKFLICYNLLLLILIGLLIFLLSKGLKNTPVITIVPVIIFMCIFEIIFINKFRNFLKNK